MYIFARMLQYFLSIFFKIAKKKSSKVVKHGLLEFLKLRNPYWPELSNWPKMNNSCSKIWPIDQLYIELGCMPL
jgi:hypothetical protein